MLSDIFQILPKTVRYIKNGQGGTWWPSAKKNNQLHLGWKLVPHALIQSKNFKEIEPIVRAGFNDAGAATRDFNQLCNALDFPSKHVWVTVEDGFLWWSTVKDDLVVNPDGESMSKGHFWLTCETPWRNTSRSGRLLAVSDLPGGVTKTAGFKSTICEPGAAAAIRRIILDELDEEALEATTKRVAYQQSLENLIRRLSAKDFELLIDLILARTGWVRTTFVGKTKEGVDIEAENIATNELAFVQVKSSANQAVLIDYIQRYEARRENYDRMIMAVHSPTNDMRVPETADNVQLWMYDVISKLSVRLGLGSWIESRLS